LIGSHDGELCDAHKRVALFLDSPTPNCADF
jgi:hypothetical protein